MDNRSCSNSSLDAAIVTGSLCSMFLGENASLTCVVDSGDCELVSCPARLLQIVDLEHPVGHLLASTCLSQHALHGCGTKTLMAMIGYWAKAAQELLDQGIPARAIQLYMEEGLELCISHLDSISLSLLQLLKECEKQGLHSSSSQISHQGQPGSGSTKRDLSSMDQEQCLKSNSLSGHQGQQESCSSKKGFSTIKDEPPVKSSFSSHHQGQHGSTSSMHHRQGKRAHEETFNASQRQRIKHEDEPESGIRSISSLPTHDKSVEKIDMNEDDDVGWFFDGGIVPDVPSISESLMAGFPENAHTRKEFGNQSLSTWKSGTSSPSSHINEFPSDFEMHEKDGIFSTRNAINKKHFQDKHIRNSLEGEETIFGSCSNPQSKLRIKNSDGISLEEEEDDDFDSCFDGIEAKDSTVRTQPGIAKNSVNTSMCGMKCTHSEKIDINTCDADDDAFDSCFDEIQSKDSTITQPSIAKNGITTNMSGIKCYHSEKIDINTCDDDEDAFDSSFDGVEAIDSSSEMKPQICVNEEVSSNSATSITEKKNHLEVKLKLLMKKKNSARAPSVYNSSRHFRTMEGCVQFNKDSSLGEREEDGCTSETKSKDSHLDAELRLQMNKVESIGVASADNSSKYLRTMDGCTKFIKDSSLGDIKEDAAISEMEAKKNILETKLRLIMKKDKPIYATGVYNSSRHFRTMEGCVKFNNDNSSGTKEKDDDEILEMNCIKVDRNNLGEIIQDSSVDDKVIITSVLQESENSSDTDVYSKTRSKYTMNTRKQDFRFIIGDTTEMAKDISETETIADTTKRSKDISETEPMNSTKFQISSEKESYSKTRNKHVMKTGFEDITPMDRGTRAESEGIAEAINLSSISRTRLREVLQCLSHGNHMLMDILIDMLWKQNQSSSLSFDKSRVSVCCIDGPPSDRSRSVDGAVLLTDSESISQLCRSKKKKRRFLLVNGSVKSSYRHTGFRTTITEKSVRNSASLDASHGNVWYNELTAIISKLEVDLLLVKGEVDSSLQDFCAGCDVLVLQGVPYPVLQGLASMYLIDILTYLSDATQFDVGSGLQVSPLDTNWLYASSTVQRQHYVCLHTQDLFQTAVLCHPCPQYLPVMEEGFWHCANRISTLASCQKLLQGGGAAEERSAQFLMDEAEKVRDAEVNHTTLLIFRPAIFSALAQGLLNFKAAVTRNRQKNDLQEAGTEKRSVETQFFEDADCDVCDIFLIKVEMWRTAIRMVSLLVNTDMHIQTGTEKSKVEL